MTHSLHREGDVAFLQNDYVILIYPARGVNAKGSGEKLKKLARTLCPMGAVNYLGSGIRKSILSGTTIDQIAESMSDKGRLWLTFSERRAFVAALKKIKEEDFGLSVTVSGLIDEVRDVCRELGLKPHTINLSLGVHGRTDLLADPETRQITTMCGHGMISPKLVKDLFSKCENGKMSIEEASRKVCEPCVCGISNPHQAKVKFAELKMQKDKLGK